MSSEWDGEERERGVRGVRSVPLEVVTRWKVRKGEGGRKTHRWHRIGLDSRPWR